MSSWSYVLGTVRARIPSRTNAETVYIAQTIVDHLPKIRGSEGAAKVRVYLEDGYNMSSNTDEFGEFSNLGNDEDRYSNFHTQNKVLITVSGYLRDADFNETVRNTKNFLCRLAKRAEVSDCVVKVNSEEEEYIFTNKNCWLENLYPGYEEKKWADYLTWEPNRDNKGQYIGGKPRKLRNDKEETK